MDVQPIRGEECVWGIGRRVGGMILDSLVEVMNFNLDPDIEMKLRSPLGSKTKKADVQFGGWNWDFEVNEKNSSLIVLTFKIIERELKSLPPEELYVFFKRKWRGAPEGQTTIYLSGSTMVPQAMGAQDRESYTTQKFKGFSEHATYKNG